MTYNEGKGHKEATLVISGQRPDSHHSSPNTKKGHNETNLLNSIYIKDLVG